MGASFVLIVLFMAVYYRRLGMVANLCLVVTAVLIYATLSVFDATITLPGLAGLVLTIGMAVDTNILSLIHIFARLAGHHGVEPLLVNVSEITSDHALSLTTGPKVSDSDLKHRLQGCLLYTSRCV